MTLSPRRLYLIVALSAIVPFLGALGNGFAQDDVSIIAMNVYLGVLGIDRGWDVIIPSAGIFGSSGEGTTGSSCFSGSSTFVPGGLSGSG